MPRMERLLVALALGLVTPAAVRAGLYAAEPPPEGANRIPRGGVKAIPPSLFCRDYLPEWRRIAQAQPESSLRKKYLERKEELERKRRRGPLTAEDQVNLSYYQVRLGSPLEALGVLREAQRSGHFMVFANLATVHVMMANLATTREDVLRDLVSARFYQRELLRSPVWSRGWPGWTPEQRDWYQFAEKRQMDLINQRLQEAKAKPSGSGPTSGQMFDRVDALFPIDFSGPESKYEAGKPPAGGKAKRTGKEIPLVQQLLFWMPRDGRLYWLLGELLNASGDVPTAARVLEDCMKQEWGLASLPRVREHRAVLAEAARQQAREQAQRTPQLPDLGPAADGGAPAPGKGSWEPEPWQWALVGVGGGLVVLLLGYLQVREIRRRRAR